MDTAETARTISLHNPPVAYPELPPTGGKVGPEPDDFFVVEVPAYAARGQGQHQYVLVQKQPLTTPALLHLLGQPS